MIAVGFLRESTVDSTRHSIEESVDVGSCSFRPLSDPSFRVDSCMLTVGAVLRVGPALGKQANDPVFRMPVSNGSGLASESSRHRPSVLPSIHPSGNVHGYDIPPDCTSARGRGWPRSRSLRVSVLCFGLVTARLKSGG